MLTRCKNQSTHDIRLQCHCWMYKTISLKSASQQSLGPIDILCGKASFTLRTCTRVHVWRRACTCVHVVRAHACTCVHARARCNRTRWFLWRLSHWLPPRTCTHVPNAQIELGSICAWCCDIFAATARSTTQYQAVSA